MSTPKRGERPLEQRIQFTFACLRLEAVVKMGIGPMALQKFDQQRTSAAEAIAKLDEKGVSTFNLRSVHPWAARSIRPVCRTIAV